MGGRTALLICCSVGQAQKIRREAEFERRTVAGYVLNIVSRALRFEEQLAYRLSRLPLSGPRLTWDSVRMPGKRTAVLIRCGNDEANRIRVAAKRRCTTISGFVLHCLIRSWEAKQLGPASLSRATIGRKRTEAPG